MFLEKLSSPPLPPPSSEILGKMAAINKNQIQAISEKISAVLFQGLGSRAKADLMQKVMKKKGPPYDAVKALFIRALRQKGQREVQEGKTNVLDGTQGLAFLISIRERIQKSLTTYFSKTENVYYDRISFQISDREGEKLMGIFEESIKNLQVHLDSTEIPNDYSLSLELDRTERENNDSLHFILLGISEKVEISRETFSLASLSEKEDSSDSS